MSQGSLSRIPLNAARRVLVVIANGGLNRSRTLNGLTQFWSVTTAALTLGDSTGALVTAAGGHLGFGVGT